MKTEEADQIIAAVESLYSFKVESPDIWSRTLCRVDAGAASEVVINQWARGRNAPRFKPTLPDLMQAIRAEEKMAERESAAEAQGRSALIPPDVTEAPEWVLAWQLLRKRGDMRAFPEQEEAYRRLDADYRASNPYGPSGYEWPPPEGVVDEETRALLLMEVGAD